MREQSLEKSQKNYRSNSVTNLEKILRDIPGGALGETSEGTPAEKSRKILGKFLGVIPDSNQGGTLETIPGKSLKRHPAKNFKRNPRNFSGRRV